MRNLIFAGICLLGSLAACTSKQGNPDQIRQVPTENTYSENTKINSITKAIEDAPDNANNYFIRAKLYRELKKNTQAIADIETATSLDSTNGLFFLEKAKIYRAASDVPKGLKAARRAEALKVELPELYVTIGEMLIIAKDYQRAMDYLNKGIRVAPFFAEAYFYKGLIFWEKGDTALALSNLQTSIEQDPEYVDAYNKLASIYLAKNNLKLAYQYLQSGMRFNPEDAYINYNMGCYYEVSKQQDSAITFFKKAIFFDPSLYSAHYNLATLAYQNRNYTEAATHYENVNRYTDNMPESHFYLGICYETQGKNAEAVAQYEKVLQLNNGYTEPTVKMLGSLRKRMEIQRRLEAKRDSAQAANSIVKVP